MVKSTNKYIKKMEELIKEIRKRIVKCELSRMKEKKTHHQKECLDAMVSAYNNVIFEIEINKEYYIQKIKNNL